MSGGMLPGIESIHLDSLLGNMQQHQLAQPLAPPPPRLHLGPARAACRLSTRPTQKPSQVNAMSPKQALEPPHSDELAVISPK